MCRRTALHVAAAHGQAGVVSALASGGADCGAADAAGDTALHVAAREGHAPAARALLADTDLDAAAANLKGDVTLFHRWMQASPNPPPNIPVFCDPHPAPTGNLTTNYIHTVVSVQQLAHPLSHVTTAFATLPK